MNLRRFITLFIAAVITAGLAFSLSSTQEVAAYDGQFYSVGTAVTSFGPVGSDNCAGEHLQLTYYRHNSRNTNYTQPYSQVYLGRIGNYMRNISPSGSNCILNYMEWTVRAEDQGTQFWAQYWAKVTHLSLSRGQSTTVWRNSPNDPANNYDGRFIKGPGNGLYIETLAGAQPPNYGAPVAAGWDVIFDRWSYKIFRCDHKGYCMSPLESGYQ